MSDQKPTATIHALPHWKKGPMTAAEWLQEMAADALAYPEKYGGLCLIYTQKDANGHSCSTRWRATDMTCTELLGELVYTQTLVVEHMRNPK